MKRHSGGMKVAPCIGFGLALAACSQGGADPSAPKAQDVDRLEAMIATHPCVRKVDDWERNYRFGMSRRLFWPQSDHPDFDVIEFHYRRVGTLEIKAARNRFGYDESGDWPDSSPIRTVDGSFAISSGRLNIRRCRPL